MNSAEEEEERASARTVRPSAMTERIEREKEVCLKKSECVMQKWN